MEFGAAGALFAAFSSADMRSSDRLNSFTCCWVQELSSKAGVRNVMIIRVDEFIGGSLIWVVSSMGANRGIEAPKSEFLRSFEAEPVEVHQAAFAWVDKHRHYVGAFR